MADKLAVIAEIVPGGSGFHVVDAKNVAYKGDDLSKYLASNEEEVGDKADKEYVDTELAKKANASDFNAYKTSNNAEVAKKANTSDVNTELGKKLNTSDFNTYKSVNDAAVAGKVNKSYVDTELAKKANTSDLAGKANASDVAALQTAVNNKADGTTVSALAGRVSTNETNIAAANARIDGIVAIPPGSTEGNTELIDIRTGSDGKNYATAGDAVRQQITDLKSDLNNFIGVDVKTLSPAYFGNFYNANGEIKTSAYWSATYIEDIDYDKIEYFAYTNTTSYYAVAFYSSGVARDSDFISGITYNVADVKDKITIRRADIPKNAKIIVFFNRSYSGTDVSVTGYKTTISSDVKNLVNLFDWKSESNLLNNYTSVTGKYVSYSNGAIGTNPDYEYYVIPVTQGKKYKLNKKDHIAFFSSSTITQSNYISGLMCNKLEEINVPSGATHVTVSVPISFKSWFNYSDVDYIENTTIKTECLPNNRIIVGGSDGSYTNIVRAVLDAKVGTEIIVRSGTYDLEAQFKAVYGNDFFDNYQGYTSTNNYDLSGLYLKKGVKLIADGGVVLSFMYSGSNAKVSEEFSPINMTIDNVVDGVIIKINANARYHIHDDFAFHAFMNINNYGSNEIKNCVFLGNPTKGASIGGGMGTYCKYYIHDNRFENTIGDAITYHNSSFGDAQNFIDVYNNYCITGIKIWWYGASKKITTALVHNNYASDIVCEKLPNFDAPNVNVEMKAWNNVTN